MDSFRRAGEKSPTARLGFSLSLLLTHSSRLFLEQRWTRSRAYGMLANLLTSSHAAKTRSSKCVKREKVIMADDESKDLNPGWLFLVIAVVTFLVVLYVQSAPKPPVASSGAVAQGAVESKKAAPSASVVEPQKALGTEEIARRCDSAIGILRGRHASGTGFLVAPGLLATNSHVVSLERIENIRVTFPAARRGPLTAELIFEDPHRDLRC